MSTASGLDVGQLNRVVKNLVTGVLAAQPADAVGYMIERLLQIKASGGSVHDQLLYRVLAHASELGAGELGQLAASLAGAGSSSGGRASATHHHQLMVLGPPGSRSSEMAARLSAYYHLQCLSTAEAVRAAVEAGDPAGLEAAAATDRGEAVPEAVTSEIMCALLRSKLGG